MNSISKVCPSCESSRIYPRSTAPEWRCMNCDNIFSEPNIQVIKVVYKMEIATDLTM